MLTEPRDPKYRNWIFTVPNVICMGRLVGAIVLIGVAASGNRYWFVGLFICLSLSDWIDGRLARWMHQRSDFGAQLDSAADAILYGALLVGSVMLSWEVLKHEMGWVGVGLASYALTTGAGLWKYGRVPSYHTYGAKISQWFVLAGALCLNLDWSVWPLRVAMLAGTLTNLEATAITIVLDKWRSDVLSVFYVWPRNRLTTSVPEARHE